MQYVCGSCHRTCSKEEHNKNGFCKTCGSPLIPVFTAQFGSFPINQTTADSQSTGAKSKEKNALIRAAESLRQRIAHTREYKVISENEKQEEHRWTAPVESWIWNLDYEEALELKKELTAKHKGKTLEEAIPGEVRSNDQGQCYAISSECTSEFKKVTYEESRRFMISDLKLIAGIGPVRERTLKQQGYKTIEQLQNHILWRKPAEQFMKLIDSREIGPAQKWLWQRLPKSHPLLHYLAGFCEEENFAIVDIETLGLSERPIVLLGIAKPSKHRICTHQYLLRDIEDEPSAIWSLVSELEPDAPMITFNGKSFDLPYIKQRLAYYGLDAPLDNPHFDVLHFTRRALREKLVDCRLETVEKYLGIKRDINIPGALVPSFYDTYLRTRNVGPLVAIVEHNKQDLLTLGTLFSKLYEEWNA